MRSETLLVLGKYSSMFAEISNSVFEYFEALEKDEKPAVHIEIYSEKKMMEGRSKTFTIDPKRHHDFKNALQRLGFYVFQSRDWNLSVSKIPSVAYWLSKMDEEGLYKNSGSVGLLLGYPPKEVLDYIKRTKEEDFTRGAR
jgi:hypothetical protein